MSALRARPARPGSRGPARRPGRSRRRRNPRTATLGSTTYDEAAEVAEPAWDGADWYGPTSGTYWTVNPKEYADPRKHGPEYLARWAAARHARGRVQPPAGPPPESPAPDRADTAPRNTPNARQCADSAGPAGPGEATSQAEQQSNAGTPSPAGSGPIAAPRRAAARSRVATPPAAAQHPRTAKRTWPGRAERLAAGVLGWLPFGARVIRWRRARVQQQADRAPWRASR